MKTRYTVVLSMIAATGQALAYLYARSTESKAVEASKWTFDETRRIAVNIAKLPDYSESERATDSLLEMNG